MATRSAGPQQARPAAPVIDQPDTAKTDDDVSDHLRHIICMLCYPAFAESRQAPHDAICICGKRLRKGVIPAPSTAAQCILCNELWEHHRSTVHPHE